ncbi:unnamed protein product [Musa acuminata subsp. burmannicoides]
MMEVDLVAKALRLMLCVLNLFLLDIGFSIKEMYYTVRL